MWAHAASLQPVNPAEAGIHGKQKTWGSRGSVSIHLDLVLIHSEATPGFAPIAWEQILGLLAGWWTKEDPRSFCQRGVASLLCLRG